MMLAVSRLIRWKSLKEEVVQLQHRPVQRARLQPQLRDRRLQLQPLQPPRLPPPPPPAAPPPPPAPATATASANASATATATATAGGTATPTATCAGTILSENFDGVI